MPSANFIRRTVSSKNPAAFLGLCMVLLGMHAPQTAEAGTYKMYACHVPGHPTPVPTIGPWTWRLDNLNTVGFDYCAAGGNFGIGLNPGQRFMRQGTSAWLTLRRPGEGPFSRIGIVRYRTWLIAQLAGVGAPAFIADGGAFGPPGGTTSDGSPWVSPLFPHTNQEIRVQLFCSAGAPTDCFFHSTTPLQARGIEVDLYEETPPSATIVGGGVLSGGQQSGMRTLSYSAADQESGVAVVEALVGDSIVGRHHYEADPASCPHTGFNACQGTRSSDMRIDTSAAPAGRHPLSLRVIDAAGNRTVVPGPTVDIGSQMPGDVQLTARFQGSARRSHTAKFGQKVIVRGRLVDRQKRGIANAEIQVSERFALPGTREPKTRRVLTRRDGSFVYGASRHAPSRHIRFRYAGRLGGRDAVAARTLALNVRASARLRVSLRGILVRYSGHVVTTPLPRGGKLVHMQGRAKGGVWQTFAKRRTTRRGRFAGSYRLRVHRPGVRLQFRVRIPRENSRAAVPVHLAQVHVVAEPEHRIRARARDGSEYL